MIFGVRQDLTIIWNLFFFSSRRRHTRWPRDWSSDVCSSDLHGGPVRATTVARAQCCCLRRREPTGSLCPVDRGAGGGPGADRRSEERRVGKEGVFLWGNGDYRVDSGLWDLVV